MGLNTTSQMLQLSVTHHDFGLILQKKHFISRPICQHTNGICIQSLWLNSLCLDQGFWNQPSEGSWTPKIIKWDWWLKLVVQQVLILFGFQGLGDVQFWAMVEKLGNPRSTPCRRMSYILEIKSTRAQNRIEYDYKLFTTHRYFTEQKTVSQ